MVLKKMAKWILRDELWKIYDDGWKDGVNQERLHPESTLHHVTEEY